MKAKSLSTSNADFELNEGILYLTYKAGLTVTIDIAREIIKTRLEFTENRPFPILIMDQGIVSIEKEARDLFSSKEGTSQLIAAAMVLKSAYGRLAGYFFLKVTSPGIPVKIFDEPAKALEWLRTFLTK